MLNSIIIERRDQLTLVHAESTRRELVRELVVTLGSRLVLFKLTDTSLSVLVQGERPRQRGDELRELVAACVPQVQVTSPHVELLTERQDIERCARSLLVDTRGLGLGVHPVLATGSCIQDLIGARALGLDVRAFRTLFPWLAEPELLRQAGLDAYPLVPATDAAFVRAGAARLMELGAAVVGAGPELTDRRHLTVEARELVVGASLLARVPSATMAELLQVTARAVRKIAERRPKPALMNALRLRIALEERVRARAGVA